MKRSTLILAVLLLAACSSARTGAPAGAPAAAAPTGAPRVGPVHGSVIVVGGGQLGPEVWGNNNLLLPPEAPDDWVDVFTGAAGSATASAAGKCLPLQQIFRHLPVALVSSSS